MLTQAGLQSPGAFNFGLWGWQQTSSCRFEFLDACIAPSPAPPPASHFQVCNMEQGSPDSKWCDHSLHTSFSFASPTSPLDAQGSFVSLGSDPAMQFKHALHFKHLEIPLGSIAACSLMICRTVA